MKRLFLNTFFLVFGICLLAFRLEAAAQDHAFFRINSSSNTYILGVRSNGILTWSNTITSGPYTVERSLDLTNGSWAPYTRGTFSNLATGVKVTDLNTPDGYSFIPGGRFLMGDSNNDSNVFSVANPVHTVQLSPFFMKRFEMNNAEVRSIYQWARDNVILTITSNGVLSTDGSTNFLLALNRLDTEILYSNGVFSVKAGRDNYPCVWISWYGSVAACNWLSQMKGKEPVYHLTNWTADFSKNGYRLPTESEWEFAARAGYEGYRFPWGDTNIITHSRANDRSDSNYWYDVSPTRGFHPDYANLQPRSSPVGTFAPNNYGLYDMSGNIWEWCWDWYNRYPAAAQVDPTGPATGLFKTMRGGSWFTVTASVTVASRYPSITPIRTLNDIGFRTVLPARP